MYTLLPGNGKHRFPNFYHGQVTIRWHLDWILMLEFLNLCPTRLPEADAPNVWNAKSADVFVDIWPLKS